jgi:hypothetical protein
MQPDRNRWPIAFLAGLALIASAACMQGEAAQAVEAVDQAPRFAREGAQEKARGEEPADTTALRFFRDGRQIFRFDTFGDEAFWGTRSSCTRQSRAPRSVASVRA